MAERTAQEKQGEVMQDTDDFSRMLGQMKKQNNIWKEGILNECR